MQSFKQFINESGDYDKLSAKLFLKYGRFYDMNVDGIKYRSWTHPDVNIGAIQGLIKDIVPHGEWQDDKTFKGANGQSRLKYFHAKHIPLPNGQYEVVKIPVAFIQYEPSKGYSFGAIEQ